MNVFLEQEKGGVMSKQIITRIGIIGLALGLAYGCKESGPLCNILYTKNIEKKKVGT